MQAEFSFAPPKIDRREELRRACIAFHRKNPEVWRMFRRFACDRRAQGFCHYSAKAIWHRLRWEIETPGDENVKLNNNFPSFYARALMRLDPSFLGFFELRRQISRGREAKGEPDRLMPAVDPMDDLSELDEWPLEGGT